jgi:REP element-mobilizing transposase RayT
VNTLDGVPLAIGGVIDHVHVLVSLGPTHRLCDVVRDVKRQSSAWIHDEIRDLLFTWQDGYGVFSVSPTHLQSVRNYIATQEEHHRSQSFKEEYVEFLKRGGIEYEERYLW